MEFSEALSIAANLKNHFQAFAKLEEVLKDAAAREANKGDLEREISGLQQLTQDHVDAKETANQARKDAEQAHEEALLKIEREHAETMAATIDQHTGLMERLAKEAAGVREDLERGIENLKSAKGVAMDALSDVEEKLADAKQAYEDLKGKFQ